MKFGVQFGISGKIFVGNINKKGNMFLNKEDKTVDILNSVIELIKSNDKENKTTELVDGKNRYIVSLTIKSKE